MEIISQKEAEARGFTKYFTGKPCKHGHLAPRYTNGTQCCTCSYIRCTKQRLRRPDLAAQRCAEWRRRYPGRQAEMSRKWRLNNLEKDLRRHQRYREKNRPKVAAYRRKYRRKVAAAYRALKEMHLI